MRFLTAVLFLFSFNSISQKNVLKLGFYIELDSSGINLDGTEIQLFQNNQLIETTFSDSLGKAKLSIFTPNTTYHLKFKRKGFVTKLAELDLNSYFFDDPDFFLFGTEIMYVTLFKPLPHENFSFLEQEPMIKFHVEPTGSFPFDTTSLPNINYDRRYSSFMYRKVSLCKAGLTASQAENYMHLTDSDQFEDKNEAYKQAVELGDILLNVNEFRYAKSIYTTAFYLAIKKKYVCAQIEQCNKHLERKN